MSLSIAQIQRDFFSGAEQAKELSLVGWTSDPEANSTFVEPPLVVKSDEESLNAKIWLVSAPGAVGKSTFARQLAKSTGSIFIDLAVAQAIGGNYITGGLIRNGLLESWTNGTIALLIDALDEATLRVTFESKIDFFDDIISLSKQSKFPIIVFGRSIAIEESSIILEYNNVPHALISIDYFSRDSAKELIFNLTHEYLEKEKEHKQLHTLMKHKSTVSVCIENILQALDDTANVPGRSFSGYAPVLGAVAVFLSRQKNFAAFGDVTKSLLGGHILQNICRIILEREQGKLRKQLVSIDESKKAQVYCIKEQMRALNHVCSGGNLKHFSWESHSLEHEDYRKYTQAAQGLLEQHPFLVDGKNPTNEVFSGALQSFAVKNHLEDGASYFRKHNVSPLFAEFYFHDSIIYDKQSRSRKEVQESVDVKPEHVAPLFIAYEARAEQGKNVYLSIDSDTDSFDADVSISLIDQNTLQEIILESFTIPSHGTIIFDRRAISANITGPNIEVVFRSNDIFSITSPLIVDVNRILFDCKEIHAYTGHDKNYAISLCANDVRGNVNDLRLFGEVELFVEWQGCKIYPWSNATSVTSSLNNVSPDVQIAFHSFCKLIRSFRSHSKGSLARFEDKINHARMSKNYGREIKELLLKKKVLTYSNEDRMFYLNTDRLACETDMDYTATIQKKCSDKLQIILSGIVV